MEDAAPTRRTYTGDLILQLAGSLGFGVSLKTDQVSRPDDLCPLR